MHTPVPHLTTIPMPLMLCTRGTTFYLSPIAFITPLLFLQLIIQLGFTTSFQYYPGSQSIKVEYDTSNMADFQVSRSFRLAPHVRSPSLFSPLPFLPFVHPLPLTSISFPLFLLLRTGVHGDYGRQLCQRWY